MKLKTLISIKFIISVVAFFCISYQIGIVTDSYKNLERQNEILKDQIELYKSLLSQVRNNKDGEKVLYDMINGMNSNLESNSKKNTFSLNNNIKILFGLGLIFIILFSFLNSKIEKLKSDESEYEKNHLL